MKILPKMVAGLVAIFSITVFLLPEASAALDGTTTNETSSLYMFICSLLVFIMAPAIAIFYGGMLRKQSMTSLMAQCIGVMALVGFVWWAVGYSLALTGDGYFIGTLDAVFGNGLSISEGNGNIPTLLFMMFQGMFAIVTACIVFGATAERIRYPAILAFLGLWAVFVYAPMAHMVWGGGLFDTWFQDIGLKSQDFAGGTAVHICSGISGVAAAVAIGRRSERLPEGRSHNVPLMFIGCMTLWLGWFGFNCGSEGAFDDIVVLAAYNTLIASCVSTIVWIFIQYIHVGRVNVTGLCAGVLAGLVAITPGCGFVEPWAAAVIGAIGAFVGYFGILFMRGKTEIDDALDVMGLHGFGGIWGAISVGIFSVSRYSWVGTGGLIEGNLDLLGGQILSVAITLVYCFAASFVIMKIIDIVMKKLCGKGAKLTEDEQMIGADIIEHGEPSYLM